VVEPAASFVAQVSGFVRTIYVGPEEPANTSVFTEWHLGKAGEVPSELLDITDPPAGRQRGALILTY
jgi:hypothetical protein